MKAEYMRTLANMVLFQAAWWASVLGAARGYAWLGVMAVVGVAVLHVIFIARQRQLDLLLAVCAVVVGAIADTAVAAAGAITFGPQAYAAPLAPPFMLALWINLALTLTTMLNWMRRRYVAGAIFGAVGGPLAYYAGARLGALALGPLPEQAALICIALEWLIAMPVLLFARERLASILPRGAYE